MLKRFGFVVPWLAMLASLGSGTAAAQQAPAAAGRSDSAAGRSGAAARPSGAGCGWWQAAPAQGSGLPMMTVCGQQGAPAAQPPAGSPPVVLFAVACFEAQGGTSVIEPQTYAITSSSRPASRRRASGFPYEQSTEQILREDFKRLLATNFLDNLSVELEADYMFPNGTIGKMVVYRHGGARAHQDRSRLRGQQEGRDLEDRRSAQG